MSFSNLFKIKVKKNLIQKLIFFKEDNASYALNLFFDSYLVHISMNLLISSFFVL